MVSKADRARPSTERVGGGAPSARQPRGQATSDRPRRQFRGVGPIDAVAPHQNRSVLPTPTHKPNYSCQTSVEEMEFPPRRLHERGADAVFGPSSGQGCDPDHGSRGGGEGGGARQSEKGYSPYKWKTPFSNG